MKVTLPPSGVPAPGGIAVMVAVKVRAWPKIAVAAEAVRDVAVRFVTVTALLPVTVPLVTVTVPLAGEAGAVSRPAESIKPTVVVQAMGVG